MRKKRLFDWAAASLFAGVAAVAVVSLGGTAHGEETWVCPEEGDNLLRITGHGIDGSATRACTEARRDANTTCHNASRSQDCCRFGVCSPPTCIPGEQHGICFASVDAWPLYQVIVIDGGDDGGSGSGSGD